MPSTCLNTKFDMKIALYIFYKLIILSDDQTQSKKNQTIIIKIIDYLI